MATWTDVGALLHANFRAEDVGDGLIRLSFQVAGGGPQTLLVSRLLVMGDHEWVAFSTPIGQWRSVDIVAALHAVADYTAVGLCAVGESLLVRSTASLRDVDVNDLVGPMLMVLHAGQSIAARSDTGGNPPLQ